MVSGCKLWWRPSCEIITPQYMTQFGKGEVIEVTVEAEDPNGNDLEIKFLVNGAGVYSTTVYPFRFLWDTEGYEEGNYTIVARAVDHHGWISEDSTTVVISVSSPRVTTEQVVAINLTSATVQGTILTDGGSPILETGFYWSLLSDPEVSGDRIRVISAGDQFSTALTGLGTNTPYYYKAFAVNSIGESIGEERGFKTLGNELGSFTDSRDGREYGWVRIGNQTWMAENLAWLPSIDLPDEGSNISARYYVYNYFGESVAQAKTSSYYNKYGVLYNWKASLNACPSGWHLPTDAEWKELEMALGMNKLTADNAGWRGTVEGRLLKAKTGWQSGGNGSNLSDFTALAGGYRVVDNTFRYDSTYANFWTAGEYGKDDGWARYLYYNNTGVYRGPFKKGFGFSVRCVKD
jgi:uncharacterized protein (TIGR02145 family)